MTIRHLGRDLEMALACIPLEMLLPLLTGLIRDHATFYLGEPAGFLNGPGYYANAVASSRAPRMARWRNECQSPKVPSLSAKTSGQT